MTTRKLFSTQSPDGKEIHLYAHDSGDPEIYIDGAWGNMVSQLNCKLMLYTTVFSNDDTERREVVARLVMSLPVVFAFRDYLDRFCRELEERGVVSPGAPESENGDDTESSGNMTE